MRTFRFSLFLSALLMVLATALFAASSGTIRGKVTTAAGDPIPNAQVVLVGTNWGAAANEAGEYVINNIPPGTYTLQAQVIGYKHDRVTVNVTANDVVEQNFSLKEEVIELEALVTIGSRAAHAAADELAVPVDVFADSQLREAAATSEMNQMLERLAPSFNFPRPTISDGTDSVRPATLRGLGPDQVLVLMNGKRRHPSALVNVNGTVGRGSAGADLNAIPAEAIESVEVLRDGAAAQYGSDAIAGVINLDLRSGVSPLTVAAKAGQTTHSDGELYDVTATWGLPVSRGSLFLVGEYRDRNPTNRAGIDPRDQIVEGDAGNNPVPQPNHHWGDSKMRDWLAFANLKLPLNESGSSTFYAFGNFNHRFGSHGGFYRRSLDNRNWPQIYPIGFLPTIEPHINDYSGTAGVQGVASDWIYDFSAQYGYDKFQFNVVNSLNASLGPDIPPNQTEFYAGSLFFKQFVANADISRQIFVNGLAGPLNLAFGAEFRRENYKIAAGEEASYIDGGHPNQHGGKAAPGSQVFPGFRPSNEVNAFRNNVGVYADLEAKLHPNFLVDVAGRFVNYEDFGSKVTGKLALRFQPTQSLVLRAAASTGFRAPALQQAYFNSTATVFRPDPETGETVPFEVGTFPVDSPVAKALGAEPLKPESSVNLSAGLAFDLTRNLKVTADYYHIEINDRIVFSGNFTGKKIAELLQPFGVNSARFFTNAIDTKTDGVDITASYTAQVGRGKLTFWGAFNATKNDISDSVATPPPLIELSNQLFPRTERTRVEKGQPKNNLKLSLRYSVDRVFGMARLNRYGEYTFSANDDPARDQTYGAEILVDAEVGFNWNRLQVALGGENLFDNFPDKTIDANNFHGIFVYPSQSPFGMNGRFLYLRTSYSLW